MDEVISSEKCNIYIRKDEIKSCVEKLDVLIIKMNNGKIWVCDKSTIKNLNENTYLIKINLAAKIVEKGKSE